MEIFKLFGSVMVDTSGAEKNLTNVDNKAKGTMNSYAELAQTAINWGNNIKSMAESVFTFADNVSSGLDQIDKQSKNMGVSTQWYQEWAYIAQRSGTDMTSIAKAVETMATNIAKPSAAIIDALDNIGVSIEDIQGLNNEELFELLITNLQNVDDPARRAWAASKLFGNAWKSMGTILSSRSDDIKGLKDRVHELGGVIDDDIVQKGAAYQDALTDWKTAIEGGKAAIGEQLLPVLTKLVLYGTEHVIPFFQGVASVVGSVVSTISEMAESIANFTWGDFVNNINTVLSTPEASTQAGYIDPSIYSYNDYESYLPERFQTGKATGKSGGGGSFASGLSYVPYDHFPASLHRGEMILDAQAAENYRSGAGGGKGSSMILNQYISSVPQTAAELAAATKSSFERAVWLI